MCSSTLASFALLLDTFSCFTASRPGSFLLCESVSGVISMHLLFLSLSFCLTSNITLSRLFHLPPPIQSFCIAVVFIFFRSHLTVFLPSLLTCLTLCCFLVHYFLHFYVIVSLWISLSAKVPLPPPLLGLFFLLCYTISPTFMLSFIFMLNLPLYICARSLCLSFCSAPFVRPYEMN